MLHTMDYQGRDNFNHWLLTAFSILAVVIPSPAEIDVLLCPVSNVS